MLTLHAHEMPPIHIPVQVWHIPCVKIVDSDRDVLMGNGPVYRMKTPCMINTMYAQRVQQKSPSMRTGEHSVLSMRLIQVGPQPGSVSV